MTSLMNRFAVWLAKRAGVLVDLEADPPRRAEVALNGYRDLGLCQVSEMTVGRRQMLSAVDRDGQEHVFNASSVYLISYLADDEESWAEAAANAGLSIASGAADPWSASPRAADREPPF